jgi:hypothetical protein
MTSEIDQFRFQKVYERYLLIEHAVQFEDVVLDIAAWLLDSVEQLHFLSIEGYIYLFRNLDHLIYLFTVTVHDLLLFL